MYTWGYIKENTLSKLNLSEEEANQQGFLSRFSYCANEAMTQICSSIKPCEKFLEIKVTEDNIDKPIVFPEDFVSFSDDAIRYKAPALEIGGRVINEPGFDNVGDDFVEYFGYNEVVCKAIGTYRIPYNARWFFFTKETHNETVIPAPIDVCEAIPSYIASQCLKIDDEVKAAIYRNEYEMFLARIDDTSFRAQRSMYVGGNW